MCVVWRVPLQVCVCGMCMCIEQRAVISRIVAYVCMELSMYVASSHMYVCVTQALQCMCIDGDARMCSRAWMDVCTVWAAQWIACGVWTWCHRLPSVWIVTGWRMDASHCRLSMDERTGYMREPVGDDVSITGESPSCRAAALACRGTGGSCSSSTAGSDACGSGRGGDRGSLGRAADRA